MIFSKKRFLSALYGGLTLLRTYVPKVNELNVLPEPDGDTGSNVWSMFQHAVSTVSGLPDDVSVGEFCDNFSQGAFDGAKGSSGSIISQMIKGFCDRLQQTGENVSESAVVMALCEAAAAGRNAISPVFPGSVITVMEDVAKVAQKCSMKGTVMSELLEAIRRKIFVSVDATKDENPTLQRAGVIDAGALGFALFVEGALTVVLGDAVDENTVTSYKELSNYELKKEFVINSMYDWDGEKYRYELMFTFQRTDPKFTDDKALKFLRKKGDEVTYDGRDKVWKCHVHTDDHDGILKYFRRRGVVTEHTVQDMKSQSGDMLEAMLCKDPRPFGFVAVVPSGELATILREYGVDAPVLGGQGKNPSNKAILDAINLVGKYVDHVFLFPNNKNILVSARQVQSKATKPTTTIETRHLAQAIAALLVFDEGLSAKENADNMAGAIKGVRVANVYLAVRGAELPDGTKIQKGEATANIDMADGVSSVITDDTIAHVAVKAFGHIIGKNDNALLMYGKDMSQEEAERIGEELRASYPAVDVAVQYGGQSHYPLMISTVVEQ